MPETLVIFDEPIVDATGRRYFAHAMGEKRDDGLWQGWLEFLPSDGNAERLRSGRETTQPNRPDLEYWAQGLTRVYLAGALERAENPSGGTKREQEELDSAQGS
ncbi:MAG: hypothetical protein ACJ770_09960 [Gemmatimonadaceae bacterium]